jgi:hypothetical protein
MNKIYCPECLNKTVTVFYGCGDDKDLFCCDCGFEKKSRLSTSPYNHKYEEKFLINQNKCLSGCASVKNLLEFVNKLGYEQIKEITSINKERIEYYMHNGMQNACISVAYKIRNYLNPLYQETTILLEKYINSGKSIGKITTMNQRNINAKNTLCSYGIDRVKEINKELNQLLID